MVRTTKLLRLRRFPNLPALFLAVLCIANWPTAAAAQDVNVACDSRFAHRPDAVVRETVSFQLGSDGVWRFSGYFVK